MTKTAIQPPAAIAAINAFVPAIIALTEDNLFANNSGFTVIDAQIGEVPSALKSGIHREYALVSTVHGSPDEHIVWNADFSVIVGVAAEFFCQILFDVLGCLDRIFTNLVITTVKQLEYVTEHGSNIGTIDFLDHKQERLGGISSAVLKGFHIGAHERTGYIGISNGVLAIAVLAGHRLVCTDKISVGVIWVEGHALVLTTICK